MALNIDDLLWKKSCKPGGKIQTFSLVHASYASDDGTRPLICSWPTEIFSTVARTLLHMYLLFMLHMYMIHQSLKRDTNECLSVKCPIPDLQIFTFFNKFSSTDWITQCDWYSLNSFIISFKNYLRLAPV